VAFTRTCVGAKIKALGKKRCFHRVWGDYSRYHVLRVECSERNLSVDVGNGVTEPSVESNCKCQFCSKGLPPFSATSAAYLASMLHLTDSSNTTVQEMGEYQLQQPQHLADSAVDPLATRTHHQSKKHIPFPCQECHNETDSVSTQTRTTPKTWNHQVSSAKITHSPAGQAALYPDFRYCIRLL
jgi:hypothetical protein